ncbi:MAG: C10 family peptidase [Muribaculum sp.]|nr:C10 family peptidase [Muribaculum sp.]
MPYIDGSNNQWPAGCVTVAVGQFAYFLHYRDGLPMYAKTEATYNPSTNKFSFSNPSATAWDKMAKNLYELGDIVTAAYLGDLASSLSPSYNIKFGTGIELNDAVEKLGAPDMMMSQEKI